MIEAPIEAQRTWQKVSGLLRIYWRYGIKGLAVLRGSDELGVRVQGGEPNPLGIVEYVVSAETAMAMLARRNLNAYKLACHDIVTPCAERLEDAAHRCSGLCERDVRWFTERGTGPAQLMGLDRETAHRLHEGSVWFIHQLMEVDGPEPPAIEELLRV